MANKYMYIPKIQQASGLKGKRVMVRVGFNVPLERGKVVDAYRLKRALPTIEYLKKKGAKIVLVSHIGRDPQASLKPIANYFNRRKNIKIGFVPDALSPQAKTVIDNMQNGSVVLLENLRMHDGEKNNDTTFARQLASLADVYVNDAFSVSHRKHASIVGIPSIFLPTQDFSFRKK
jgi:phosphoglycerate kinase